MATKVRIPSRVTDVLEINYGIEELKRTSHKEKVLKAWAKKYYSLLYYK